MNGVCRGPDCGKIAYAWLAGEYCSKTCRWNAGQRAVAEAMAEAGDLALGIQVTAWQQEVLELAVRPNDEVIPAPNAGSTMLEDIRRLYREMDLLRAVEPAYPDWARPNAVLGTPVELVDTEEESTPYELGHRPPRGYSPDFLIVDEVAHFFEPAPPSQRGWLRRALDRLVG